MAIGASDPLIVVCAKNAWTKVATDVISGSVHKKSYEPQEYLQTYRVTGNAAPTVLTDGIWAFKNNEPEAISATSGIDVYIYALTSAGSVRVDL